jgi:hypothetical protein
MLVGVRIEVGSDIVDFLKLQLSQDGNAFKVFDSLVVESLRQNILWISWFVSSFVDDVSLKAESSTVSFNRFFTFNRSYY